MKTFLITVILGLSLICSNSDISMVGIKINDSDKKLDQLKLKTVGVDKESDTPMIKFQTENGNDLSITTMNGKVVYMENDWLQNKKGKQPLYSNFTFGETSLKDIRKAFGTNGFLYRTKGAFTTETDLIEFNCFEFDSPNNEILVVITKVSLNTDATEDNIAEKLKLDAIIIADKGYLEKIWGKEKAYDGNYKKIKL